MVRFVSQLTFIDVSCPSNSSWSSWRL